MVVELLSEGLGGIYETSKLLMGYQVKLAVCRCLRRGDWISIVSGVFELDTQMSVFSPKYKIASTHLFHCLPALCQFFYTHLNVIFLVTLFFGMFQLLFEVFQAFTVALGLRKKQNSGSHSDQINKVVGAVVFYVLDVDVMVRFIVRMADLKDC